MDITTTLQDEYGLNDIRTIPIIHGLIDKNYQVTSKEGTFFFKKFSSISALAFDKLRHDLQALNKAGIPAPVEVIPRKMDRTSGSFYALYAWVDGQKYNASIDQMKAVAQVFGKVVQAGLLQRSQLRRQQLVAELSNAEKKLIALARNETLRSEIQQTCWEYVRLSQAVRSKLGQFLPKKLNSLPLHPDFTERNMLFVGNEVVLLCDWQGYGSRSLLDEMASALTRFCTSAPFEGHLLPERLFSFKQVLVQDSKLPGVLLAKYAQAVPWLLIRRQICNTPFRVAGLSGPNATKTLLLKVLRWSRYFVAWVLNHETMVVDLLLADL